MKSKWAFLILIIFNTCQLVGFFSLYPKPLYKKLCVERQRHRPTFVLSVSHIIGKKKKSRSKSKLPSWFCKGPSSCAFCCRNSGVVFTARSLSGSTKASAGRRTKPIQDPDSPPAFSSHAESEKSTTLVGPLRDLLAKLCCLFKKKKKIFQFTERKCVRKVCGLRPEACKVQITTPDKCSYKLK